LAFNNALVDIIASARDKKSAEAASVGEEFMVEHDAKSLKTQNQLEMELTRLSSDQEVEKILIDSVLLYAFKMIEAIPFPDGR
jgi:hypothetical protein